MGNDFYHLRFTVDADYERVLYEGPWLIGDHVVAVKRWVPHFDPDATAIDKVVTWVQIPKLDLEYYDRGLLMRVGNRIGKFPRVDNATLTASRCNFARICVEVDLTKPLKSKFKIRRKVHRLVYEGLHNICFECGKFGHMRDRCPDAIRDDLVEEIEDRVNDLPQEEVISTEVLDPYGPWMIAQKNRRKRSPKEGTGDNHKQQMPKSQPPTPKKVADDVSKNANYQEVSSSKFGVLVDLEDEGDLHGLEEAEARSVPFNV
ncbi:hypothetical protein Tsubulata_032955 [Turnera subulata]|uniref:CCHC-type domain-containing protein n=1 Tax=Turnera subulata TaxID=218843 RepID=A0A9Q0FL12_9ROSI|nr:hypothetical protein Tsubulata_032955 [Turnera subulata]